MIWIDRISFTQLNLGLYWLVSSFCVFIDFSFSMGDGVVVYFCDARASREHICMYLLHKLSLIIKLRNGIVRLCDVGKHAPFRKNNVKYNFFVRPEQKIK